jgi:uncharacterized protein YjbI with pentapeptide repeats
MLNVLLLALLAIWAQPSHASVAADNSVPPPQSCVAHMGSIANPGADLPVAVDGTTIKDTDGISKLRKSKPNGALIIINGGNFAGWHFKGAKLNNICFRDTDLSNSNWNKVTASGIGFIDSKLSNAILERANLPFVLFRTTSLDGANARKAAFEYGVFDGGWSASVSRLRLDEANLRNFRFECGNTALDGCAFDRQKVSLRGANLSNANLYNFSFWDGDFTGAKLDGAIVGLDQINQLKEVVLDNPLLLRGGDAIRNLDRSALSVLRLGITKQSEAVAAPCPVSKAELIAPVCQSENPLLRSAADDVRYLTENGESISTTEPAIARFDRKLSACLSANQTGAQECIANAYMARRIELLDNGEEPEWVDIQKRILFVKTDFPLPSDISSNPDWRNIASVIANSSDMMLLVRDVDGEGRYAMRAKILDLTTGQCTIAHDGLGFDNNVLTAVGLVRQKGRKNRVSVSLPVAQFYRDKANFSARLLNTNNVLRKEITNCSPDASIGQMRSIPISAYDFDQLWLAMPTNGQQSLQ